MTKDLGKIAAVKLLIDSLTQLVQAYKEVRKFDNTVSAALDDLTSYRSKLILLKNKLES